MVKAIAVIKRKQGLSREEFARHYEEVHAPLVLKCFPTIRKYVRNHIVVAAGADEPDFDCITELWFDDIEGHAAVYDVWKSEVGKPIRDDEKTFIDRSRLINLLVEERVTN